MTDESNPATTSPGAPAPRTVRGQLGALAWWKTALLGLSVLLMGAGLGLPLVTGGDASAQLARTDAGTDADDADRGSSSTSATSTLTPSGFAPATDDPPADEAPTETEPAAGSSEVSPTIFRLGFSFFVGFAIGFAVRSFVKISLAVIGLFFLFVFGLEYAGLVEVRWAALSEQYDSISGWLQAEVSSFRTFITGRLPAAATAVTGLGVGFTRR